MNSRPSSRSVPHPTARRAPRTASVAVGLLLAALAGAAPARAAEPVLRLEARGAFDAASARVGDTVRYRLTVEWSDVPAAVMLLPHEDLGLSGATEAGTSTTHRKTATAGVVRNTTEFEYRLVAREPGALRIEPFRLRFHNGLSGREESVPVAGALVEIAPAAPSAAVRAGLLAAVAAALLLLGFLLLRLLRTRRRVPPSAPAPPEASPEAAALESLLRRCRVPAGVDEAAWMADAERLCTRTLCRKLGISNPANVRFEAALDRYLSRHPALPPREAAAWSTLRDLFHETRYASARNEPRPLRDACRHLETCLQHQGEPSR